MNDAVFDQSARALAVFDREGRYRRVNRKWAEIFGKRAEEFTGRTYRELFPANAAQDALGFDLLNQVLATKQTLHLPGYPYRFQDLSRDAVRYWDWVVQPILDDRGEVDCILFSAADATEREQAREALSESEARYRKLLGSVTDYVYAVQVDGGQTLATSHGPGCEAVTGYSPEEFERDSLLWNRIVHPQDRDAVLEQAARILAGETAEPLEHRITHRDGSVRWVRNTPVPRFDAGHRLVAYDGLIADITERKRRDRTIATMNFALNRVLDAAFLLDENGAVRYVNDDACRLLGYTREEFLGKSTLEIDRSLSPESWRVEWLTLKQRQVLKQERVFRARDGRMFPAELRASYFEFDGEPYCLALVRDITERKREERERQALLDSFTRMDAVNRAIQASSDPVEMGNGVLEAMLGIFECDRAWLACPDEEDCKAWRIEMERARPEYPGAIAQGRTVLVDLERIEGLRLCFSNGQPVRFGGGSAVAVPPYIAEGFGLKSQLAMAIHPKAGRPYLFGIQQCSSDRVWTEEEERLFQEIGRRLEEALGILLAYHDLQESQHRLDLALQAGRIGVFEMELGTGKGRWTPTLAEFWGTPADFDGNLMHFCRDHIHPDDDLRVRERFRELQAHGEEGEIEFRVIRPDGTLRWLRWRGKAVSDGAREYAWATGVNMDITDYKLADEAQAQLRKQLQQAQKMESIGRLAGGVAHDFNNLLTVINGYSDLIMGSLSAEDPLTHSLEQIRHAGERAAELTHQLLAFSRRQEVKVRPLNADEVIAKSEIMLRRLLGEDIELVTALGAPECLVMADPVQIHQVVMNLLVNARDAIQGGGRISLETAQVELSPEECAGELDAKPGACLMLAVADNGTGMDEATQLHIFEPFFTTKEVGIGTGLGLSTVYGIVRQAGGWIRVESSLGEGSTFRVFLPLVASGALIPEAVPTVKTAPHGTETILVVEDQGSVRKLLVQSLQICGYEVLEAACGREALEQLAHSGKPVDLLLTDVVMPGMTGPELTERLRAIRPEMKVLWISGYTADALERSGGGGRETHVLAKPFSLGVLAAEVRKALGKSRGD